MSDTSVYCANCRSIIFPPRTKFCGDHCKTQYQQRKKRRNCKHRTTHATESEAQALVEAVMQRYSNHAVSVSYCGHCHGWHVVHKKRKRMEGVI